MMRLSGICKLSLAVTAALALLCLLFDASAAAQCAMCRAAVENGSNGASFMKSFNAAVLVLLAPPVAIFCSIFAVAYRHRKSLRDAERPEAEEFSEEEVRAELDDEDGGEA